MKSCSRFLAPLLALALPAAAAAQSTTQNFRYEAPGDVRPGPITMEGQALIGAVDHSWIKFKAESEWGGFSYRLTRLDAEPGSLPAAEAPNRPAAARTSIGPVKCSTASLCAGFSEGGDMTRREALHEARGRARR